MLKKKKEVLNEMLFCEILIKRFITYVKNETNNSDFDSKSEDIIKEINHIKKELDHTINIIQAKDEVKQ